jgi:hypothetical protein
VINLTNENHFLFICCVEIKVNAWLTTNSLTRQQQLVMSEPRKFIYRRIRWLVEGVATRSEREQRPMPTVCVDVCQCRMMDGVLDIISTGCQDPFSDWPIVRESRTSGSRQKVRQVKRFFLPKYFTGLAACDYAFTMHQHEPSILLECHSKQRHWKNVEREKGKVDSPCQLPPL